MKNQKALLTIALFGLIVPNGLFLEWLFRDFTGWLDVLHNRLALAFMLDAVLATGLLSYSYATRPIGPIRWYWFLALSLAGGLGFSLPLYWWLNHRQQPQSPEPGAAAGIH